MSNFKPSLQAFYDRHGGPNYDRPAPMSDPDRFDEAPRCWQCNAALGPDQFHFCDVVCEHRFAVREAQRKVKHSITGKSHLGRRVDVRA